MIEKSTQRARQRASQYFEPLIRYKVKLRGVTAEEARKSVTEWLCSELNLSPDQFSIDRLTAEQADEVYDLCSKFNFIPVKKT